MENHLKLYQTFAPRIMPWWAHSRKATLSRVYAVKGVGLFNWSKTMF